MTLLQEATMAMQGLHALTVSFKHGSTPDAHSVLGYQSELVKLYGEIGNEMATRFGAKERAYLGRKLEEANQYKKGRIDLKKTASDSTQDALLAVGEEFRTEIDAAEEYERYRIFLRSLQNALDHSRQVVSFLKSSESNA